MIAHYHLPGLFESFEFYKVFLPLWREHRDWFYDWCDIASIYGSPGDCLWGGGRAVYSDASSEPSAGDVLALMREYGISARLTFSNSLLGGKHLADKKCNVICEEFCGGSAGGACAGGPDGLGVVCAGGGLPQNGVIVHSDLLAEYLRENFPSLYLVSSTTKVLTDFSAFEAELQRPDFKYVVPDFRLNKAFDRLAALSQEAKDKVEFLCNECCNINCPDRKACYENVSRKNLGENVADHKCRQPGSERGYRFSLAMKNPAFIGLQDILQNYLPLGFSNFKIEGRGLGSALLLEFLLYYMTKPQHQLEVRESIYLDSMLDLF